jgi:hypothetical protein
MLCFLLLCCGSNTGTGQRQVENQGCGSASFSMRIQIPLIISMRIQIPFFTFMADVDLAPHQSVANPRLHFVPEGKAVEVSVTSKTKEEIT